MVLNEGEDVIEGLGSDTEHLDESVLVGRTLCISKREVEVAGFRYFEARLEIARGQDGEEDGEIKLDLAGTFVWILSWIEKIAKGVADKLGPNEPGAVLETSHKNGRSAVSARSKLRSTMKVARLDCLIRGRRLGRGCPDGEV